MVVHNNWIVGTEAKIYRFKEMLQWNYDGTDGYYSSVSRKYLVYENTRSKDGVAGEVTWKLDKQALENALMIGGVLNRTVVLPRFDCKHGTRCNLLSWINLKSFDSVFGDRYRENLFLEHPKVSRTTVTSSTAELFVIEDDRMQPTTAVTKLKPGNTQVGPTDSELRQWFGGRTEKVLRFHSLYGRFVNLRELPFRGFSTFTRAFQKAFVRSVYRQYSAKSYRNSLTKKV